MPKLRETTEQAALQVLKKHRGNLTAAAREFGVNRQRFYKLFHVEHLRASLPKRKDVLDDVGPIERQINEIRESTLAFNESIARRGYTGHHGQQKCKIDLMAAETRLENHLANILAKHYVHQESIKPRRTGHPVVIPFFNGLQSGNSSNQSTG